MTVYSPYYNEMEDTWYVEVMTPQGKKKINIWNPLYYYHLMNVKPPVGGNYSYDVEADYDDMLNQPAVQEDYDFGALEPYQSLSDQNDLTSHKLGLFNKKTDSESFVYMSLNAHPEANPSQALIPLNLSNVQVNDLSLEKDSKETIEAPNKKKPIIDLPPVDEDNNDISFEEQIESMLNLNKAFVKHLKANGAEKLLEDKAICYYNSLSMDQSSMDIDIDDYDDEFEKDDTYVSPNVFKNKKVLESLNLFSSTNYLNSLY